ncbi:MAG TPA: trehalose-phosphatase, partial [Bryobacteraceae bacterium]|nr:trehalose-phosphatase [Bryobacteraceae bacterium]
MLSLLENWPAIAGRVRAAKSVHLFTDFDGTLTPLRQRPEEVELDPATRLALLRLGRNPRVRVCVISGRRLDDLRCCLDAPEIECRGV